LQLTCDQEKTVEERILDRDRSQLPGTIRISFGLYNTKEEIDELIEMVKKIASGDYHPFYVVDRESGTYAPKDFKFDFDKSFEF
jgi:hypothetical protein